MWGGDKRKLGDQHVDSSDTVVVDEGVNGDSRLGEVDKIGAVLVNCAGSLHEQGVEVVGVSRVTLKEGWEVFN